MSDIKHQTFSGICPVTNKLTNIDVEFIEIAPYNQEKSYIRSHFSCPNKDCPNEDCPIIKNVPQVH